jgi:hypothetical protein
VAALLKACLPFGRVPDVRLAHLERVHATIAREAQHSEEQVFLGQLHGTPYPTV